VRTNGPKKLLIFGGDSYDTEIGAQDQRTSDSVFFSYITQGGLAGNYGHWLKACYAACIPFSRKIPIAEINQTYTSGIEAGSDASS
jgi:hypothetical protein